MKMIYILFYLNSVDTECQAKDIVSQHDNHLWMWIALFEALCIIVLLFILFISRNQHIQAQRRFKNEAKKGDVDFNNIIASSFHAGDLYNQLKKVCHPDRFSSNSELMTKANDLFQQITQNKHDLKKLQKLKAEAVKELHINI